MSVTNRIQEALPDDNHTLAFYLEPIPPFRLDLTASVLRRRPDNVVDRWDGQAYRRVLLVQGRPLSVEVVQTAPPEKPRLQVTVSGTKLPATARSTVTCALERLLGTRCDLTDFYRLAAEDARLEPLVDAYRGLKPPRFPTLFEAIVNAIACQQVTLTLGIRLLNWLVEACGSAIREQSATSYGFPRPHELMGRRPEALRRMGFSGQKAHALTQIARVITDKHLDLDALAALGDDEAIAQLCELRGVGRWTAEYLLLRGMGRLHIFPGDDVGARNGLRRWLGLAEPLDYSGVQRTLAPWAPYAGLIYFHLLLMRLAVDPVKAGPVDRAGGAATKIR